MDGVDNIGHLNNTVQWCFLILIT